MRGQDSVYTESRGQQHRLPSPPSAAMTSTTTTTMGDNSDKTRVPLFEQEDSGLGSLTGFSSITSTNSSLGYTDNLLDNTSSPSDAQSPQVLSLTSGLLNLNLSSTETEGTDISLGCPDRARMEFLERQAALRRDEKSVESGFISENIDSGNFSINTTSTGAADVCEDSVSGQRHADRDLELDAARISEECVDKAHDLASRSNKIRRGRRRLAVSAEQRVALYQGDADGDNWLHLSIIDRRPDLAMAVLSVAPDYLWLSHCNHLRQTPLHLAALTGQPRLVRRLVCAGAVVDAQDLHGNTPLHIACRLGDVVMAENLLAPVRHEETQENQWEIPYQRLPQDLGVRNFEGQTPLHVAVLWGQDRVAAMLLDAGADPNVGDAKSGRTALHMAAERGRVGMVELLAARPDIDMLKRNYAGLTAAQLALGRNLGPIADFLHTASCDDVSDADSEMTLVDSDSDSDWWDEGME